MYPYCILNSSTHLLACHAVSRLIIAQNISSITRLGSIIPHQVFNALALALFVFWIFTDNSDRSFSFNDLAFFADRLYRWSYFHWKSSFRKFIKICSFLSAQIQYTHAFGLYIITAKYKMQALFWIKSHFFIFSPIFHTQIYKSFITLRPYTKMFL